MININNTLIKAATFSPNSLKWPDAWIGHIPFAAWLINELHPKVFVELGTHTGNSYFTFCQAVHEAQTSTKCYAVDTWQGDEHAGLYGDEIWSNVNIYNRKHYHSYSRLIKKKFDDAVHEFKDGTINLLHIDGLHTYEAVKHDFETWLPKLAPGAIVLFHDTNVRERNFGVWKLWEELQLQYPNNIEFTHSHGLGVLQLNDAPDDKKLEWIQPDYPEKQRLIDYFAALGTRQIECFELNELRLQIPTLNQAIDKQNEKLAAYHVAVLGRDDQIAERDKQIGERDQQTIRLLSATNRLVNVISNLPLTMLRYLGETIRLLYSKEILIRFYLLHSGA